jgi:molybdopterin molybdotransferase
MHFERVSVKPGKSQPFGEINGTPVFVLSGNPAASSMGFELYVRLAMRAMQGYTQLDRPTVKARITCDIRKKDPRVFLERAVLSRASDGGFEVVTLKNQSSALFGALQRCNCFAVIPKVWTAFAPATRCHASCARQTRAFPWANKADSQKNRR